MNNIFSNPAYAILLLILVDMILAMLIFYCKIFDKRPRAVFRDDIIENIKVTESDSVIAESEIQNEDIRSNYTQSRDIQSKYKGQLKSKKKGKH